MKLLLSTVILLSLALIVKGEDGPDKVSEKCFDYYCTKYEEGKPELCLSLDCSADECELIAKMGSKSQHGECRSRAFGLEDEYDSDKAGSLGWGKHMETRDHDDYELEGKISILKTEIKELKKENTGLET
jgi:hypothetical protein